MSDFDWSKVLLYAGAPFFSYPFKPFLNVARGARYEVALAHFWRDHDKPDNLFYHVGCLVFQLTYNFGFLHELDGQIFKGQPVFSFGTAVLWSLHLVVDSNAPISVKVASVTSISLAFRFRRQIVESWEKLMTMQAVVEALAIQIFIINKSEPVPFNFSQFLLLLALRLISQKILKQKQGALEAHKGAINLAVAMFIFQTSRDPFGRVPPFIIGIVGYVLALLTNQRWLFFYTSGFNATLAQGVAHHISRQPATLPQLTSFADEIAHATFFPNLVFQSLEKLLVEGQGQNVSLEP